MKRLSDGVTEEGRSSGCWMSRYKPVGGNGRQIHRFIRREAMSSDCVSFREVIEPMLPRKTSKRASVVTVPQTDSGGRVEHTKALVRTAVKELCKMTP
jgi:hypothetical protein